jgi:hypothetical protein
MSFDAERLYKLLPAIHRIRDAEQGYPLRELMGVIADQVSVVEENLEQLYDNQFVETAVPWALPYLGDLLGIRGLSGGGTLTLAPRALVGHTIAYRRRKGTAAMLEMLARDVTGWPARAVEFFERIAATQHVNHTRRHNRAFLSLRPADDLEFFNTAFETATRTVEVRRIKPARGKWNIPNVGLFLWRLRAYSLTRSPLTPAPAPLADNRHFRVHPLGFDLPLFTLPETEDEFSHLAEPLNVPMPITRRMLKDDVTGERTIAYNFSASTTPPSANDGTLRLNNSNPGSATHLYVTRRAGNSSEVSSTLQFFSIYDFITVSKEPAGGAQAAYEITAVAILPDFYDFTVTYQDGAGTFAASDDIRLALRPSNQFHPSADYYGAGRSLFLEEGPAGSLRPIDASRILVADLGDIKDTLGNVTGWAHEVFGQSADKILLDPMRGRVLLPPPATLPPDPTYATFHYGFSMDLGGGEYDRSRTFGARAGASIEVAKKGPTKTIVAGLAALGTTAGGVIEIGDGDRYPETIAQIDATGRQVEIRAADQRRPTLILGSQLTITGDENGAVTLNGLLIGGEPIVVAPTSSTPITSLGHLRLRHCTIVPRLSVDATGRATLANVPALTVKSTNTVVEIEGCIIGPILVGPDVTVHLKNCIVDAGTTDDVALADLAGSGAAGTWRIENCTIRGKVKVAVLELASNTIFLGSLAPGDNPQVWPSALFVQRRQEGCVRFCWLPPRARVPRRYECLPREDGPDVRPLFTTLGFGAAAYGQLGRFCDDAILRGADDESEIGAFHDLFQPQREAHLRTRLEEYLRFGLEAGIFFAT